MSDSIERRARHTPCENCREHRRKCSVPMGTSCDRCQRMHLVCLFKYPKKPKTPKTQKTTIGSTRKKARRGRNHHLIKEVCQLQRQAEAMETELQALHRDRHSTPTFTISSQKGRALRLETSINNMTDMISFMEGPWKCLFGDSTPTPLFYTPSVPDTLLAVRTQIPSTELLKRIFINATGGLVASSTPTNSSITLDSLDTNPAITQIKRRIIHTYFSCTFYFSPLLVRPYFLDYLLLNPHSMLANAVVTSVVHGPCEHVDLSGLSIGRDVFAAMMFEKTYSQLREAMFEDESLDTVITLWYLTSCLMTNLKVDEARILMTLAWRMTLQLKDEYVSILEKSEWDDPVALARAETWRRFFYWIRFIAMSLTMIFDDNPNFFQFIDASKHIGCPIVLPSEKVDPALSRAVEIYRYMVLLSMVPSGFERTTREEILVHHINAGVVNSVSQADVAFIEQRLIEYWFSLPRTYVLADQPVMSILNMHRIRECKNPSIMYLNMIYYLYWIVIQMRLMSPPETADLRGASLGRLDGERALMIVSVCCDAMVKLALVLFEKNPCTNELHWIIVVADLLLRLKNAADKNIRARAKQNLQWVTVVLSNAVNRLDRPNTSAHISSTYYDEIKTIVTQYFLNQAVE